MVGGSGVATAGHSTWRKDIFILMVVKFGHKTSWRSNEILGGLELERDEKGYAIGVHVVSDISSKVVSILE